MTDSRVIAVHPASGAQMSSIAASSCRSAVEQQQQPMKGIALSFRNVSFSVPAASGSSDANVEDVVKSKRILHSISGGAQPGELVAIIGPSGSGKSTLLSILSGRRLSKIDALSSGDNTTRNGSQHGADVQRESVSGTVLYGGRPLDKRLKKHCAFVEQQGAP